MVKTRSEGFSVAAMSISAIPSAPNPDAISTLGPKVRNAHASTSLALQPSAIFCVSLKCLITVSTPGPSEQQQQTELATRRMDRRGRQQSHPTYVREDSRW